MSDTTPLDLSDPMVRQMAEDNHQPDEVWSVGGRLLSLHCGRCGQRWPCQTRQALAALAAAFPP